MSRADAEDLWERQMLEPCCAGGREAGGWPGASTATVTSSGTEGQGQSGMPAGHLQPPAIHTVLSSKSSVWDSLAFTVTSGCLCGFSFQRSLPRPLGLPWSSNCNWKHPPPKTEQRHMLHRDSCV